MLHAVPDSVWECPVRVLRSVMNPPIVPMSTPNAKIRHVQQCRDRAPIPAWSITIAELRMRLAARICASAFLVLAATNAVATVIVPIAMRNAASSSV